MAEKKPGGGKRRLILVLLGLAAATFVLVPAWGFVRGVASYAKGDPCLLTTGLLSVEGTNLDRDTRCRRGSSGCVVTGHEGLLHAGHNAGVRLCVRVFGKPTGAWLGAYPTREEAFAALAKTSKDVELELDDPAEFAEDVGVPFAGLGEEVLRILNRSRGDALADVEFDVAEVAGEVYVIGDEKLAILVPKATGKPFAVYVKH